LQADALTEFFTTKVPLKFMKIDGKYIIFRFFFKSYFLPIGTTSPIKRGEYVQQFQNDTDTKVALLSIMAAGVG